MKRNFSNHNTHKPIIFSRQLFNKNFIHTEIFQTINNNNKTAIFQKQFSSAISAVKLPNFQVSPRLNFCNECGVRGQNLLLSKNHKIAETFQYLFFFSVYFIKLDSLEIEENLSEGRVRKSKIFLSNLLLLPRNSAIHLFNK